MGMTTARVVTTIHDCIGQRSRSIVVTTLAVVMRGEAAFSAKTHTHPKVEHRLTIISTPAILSPDTAG